MDFFTHQEQARKRTSLLVVCYAMAVAAITLGIYALFVVVLAQVDDAPAHAATFSWWHPEIFLGTLIFIPGIIFGGSAFKVMQLNRGGGASVARMLGGSPIRPDTTDPDERRILNVVEEMAIAAGVPVPPVYLLSEEKGINAFAAGYSPRDAVIGVTRGCVKNLSRDELQGVIAHEFSHIINGDMRLNIRLMGVLFGIIMITLIGRILLRTAYFSGGGRSSRGGGNKKGGNPLPFIGIGLMIIGYIGVFFASIIKSAVSRQREYLADAAAVQFTRNPGGIGGALKRIRSLSLGSKIGSVHAAEAGHLFFGDCSRHFLSMFATHPPLEARIKRIDPTGTWTSDSTKIRPAPPPPPAPETTDETEELAGAFNIMAAQAIINRMPGALVEASHDTIQSRAILYALLWSPDPAVQPRQRQALETHDPKALAALGSLLPTVQALDPDQRLPMAERLLPALRTMPADLYPAFCRAVSALTEADNEINLFEFALRSMTLRHLGSAFGTVDKAPIKYRTIEKVSTEIGTVLSALALWGTDSRDEALTCYQAGLQPLQTPIAPLHEVSLDDVGKALDTLASTAPFIKRRLIEACKNTILRDNRIGPNQYELIRAVADAIDVPMPPLRIPKAA